MQKPGIPAQQMQRTGTRERACRSGTGQHPLAEHPQHASQPRSIAWEGGSATHPWPCRDGFLGRVFFGPHEFMSLPRHSQRPPGRVGVRGSLKKPRIKNMTAPLYQHVLADSVAPRIKTLAADWQVWEFAEGATDIEYDGEYGSERVWIVSGRATIEPEDGSPSFNVGPGDVVYFLSGFQ
jgi:hypothetical protein